MFEYQESRFKSLQLWVFSKENVLIRTTNKSPTQQNSAFKKTDPIPFVNVISQRGRCGFGTSQIGGWFVPQDLGLNKGEPRSFTPSGWSGKLLMWVTWFHLAVGTPLDPMLEKHNQRNSQHLKDWLRWWALSIGFWKISIADLLRKDELNWAFWLIFPIWGPDLFLQWLIGAAEIPERFSGVESISWRVE